MNALPTALNAATHTFALSAPDVLVLHPGDVALVFAGDRVETLLGSCVAVILTDPRRTVAVMCHIVHSMNPPPGRGCDARFASPAIDAACALLHSVGIVPALCEAYLYGGGNMFPAQPTARQVGAENVRWAEAFLSRHEVRVCAKSVGGAAYRRIGWTVGAGEPAVISVAVAHGADAALPTFSG
ncbi:MAG: chemotaxis protein CheD [Pseudomonadota bacterium]